MYSISGQFQEKSWMQYGNNLTLLPAAWWAAVTNTCKKFFLKFLLEVFFIIATHPHILDKMVEFFHLASHQDCRLLINFSLHYINLGLLQSEATGNQSHDSVRNKHTSGKRNMRYEISLFLYLWRCSQQDIA